MTSNSVFNQMSLDQLEEAAGELRRRAGAALRRIGEARADEAAPDGVTPRERIASLIASGELAIATLASAAAGAEAARHRLDREPATLRALMYGAPTLNGLLTRLEQNRRVLAALARVLEPRLDDRSATAWGDRALRDVVVLHAIEEPARAAQALEVQLAAMDDAETTDERE